MEGEEACQLPRGRCSARHLGEGNVVVQVILHLQHLHVGAQSHFAGAVAVEIKLVLLEVLKVFAYCQKLLERL